MTPDKNSKRQSKESLWRLLFGKEFVGKPLFSDFLC